MAGYISSNTNYGGADTSASLAITKNASATAFIIKVHLKKDTAGTPTLSSPAYSGGGTLTLIDYSANGQAAIYVYLAQDPTGNGNFTATISANSYWEVACTQLSDCHKVSWLVVKGNGSGSSSGAGAVNLLAGEIAFDCLAMTYNDGGDLACSGGWTDILKANRYTLITSYDVFNETDGAQSNTFSWTGTENWARVLIIAQSYGGGGQVI